MAKSAATGNIILIIEQQPLISLVIAATLAERGIEARCVNSLAEVFKNVRVGLPKAVLIDLTSPGQMASPAAAMGTDHIVRVLRQAYPQLCLVALSSPDNVRAQALIREFRLPAIQKPFSSAELIATLEDCGVVSPVETRGTAILA
jgi:DNA-binding response OmpR family regulator